MHTVALQVLILKMIIAYLRVAIFRPTEATLCTPELIVLIPSDGHPSWKILLAKGRTINDCGGGNILPAIGNPSLDILGKKI